MELPKFFVRRYKALYAKAIPDSITGKRFLDQYTDHDDPVTVIDEKRTYGVVSPTVHPIYEDFRVKCHYSYSACGLGSDGTDRIVQLLQDLQHSAASKAVGGTLYGAKINGGGSGGTVCVIDINCLKSSEQILERYKEATGYLPFMFEGSSPGAGKFGYLKIKRGAGSTQNGQPSTAKQ